MSTLQQLIAERKQKEKNRPQPLTKEQLEEQVTDWCDFYRKNWDMYAKYELGITALFPFQEYIVYLIGVSQMFFLMCGRGLSKSFLSALCSFIQCMLYPRSEIVLTATTIKTAKKMVKNKMEGELCGDFSPKLKYLKDKGLIKFRYSEEEIRVDFLFNDSWILILPEADSARGERATGLVFEEVRLARQPIVNKVFMPMRHARVPAYKLKPEYSKDIRLVERAKIIYLTSTGYKFEWFWEKWKNVVEGFFNKNPLAEEGLFKYGIFTGDVCTAIDYNLFTEEDFEIVKDDPSVSAEEIAMEYYNEPQGGIEGSFYSFEKFKENSIIDDGFVPPTYEDFILKYNKGELEYFREKKDEEIRVIYVDFASADSVKKGQENDNTVIGCMCGYPDKKRKHIIRQCEYMETLGGGKKDESIKRIRELFYLYKADVLIYDNQQTGADRYNELTKPYYHEELGIQMNGFGIYNDSTITEEFCEKSRVDDLKSKVVDSNAIPVAIPVVGIPVRNQNFHVGMQNAINNGTFLMLSDSTKRRRKLEEEDITWYTKTSEEKARRMIGHIQVDKMIVEATELRKEIKNGYISLVEIAHHPKDRIVATTYANYFFSMLELKLLKQDQEEEFNEENYYDMYF